MALEVTNGVGEMMLADYHLVYRARCLSDQLSLTCVFPLFLLCSNLKSGIIVLIGSQSTHGRY